MSSKIGADSFCGHPGDVLSATADQDKHYTILLTAITLKFDAVRTNTDIALIDRDRTYVLSRVRNPAAMSIKK